MGFQKFRNSGASVEVNFGALTPKQREFTRARSRYVAYAGAPGRVYARRSGGLGGKAALAAPGRGDLL